MKILCECGHTLFDQTDYLPYKAEFISDQDNEDYWEAIDQVIEQLAATLRGSRLTEEEAKRITEQAMHDARSQTLKYRMRTMYQCSHCGRLMLDDLQSNLQTFLPATETTPKNILRSYQGNQWKRSLRAIFSSGSGHLMWSSSDADATDGGFERFDNWESLERRYFEVLTRLQEKEILRDAFIRKDGEIVHRWP